MITGFIQRRNYNNLIMNERTNNRILKMMKPKEEREMKKIHDYRDHHYNATCYWVKQLKRKLSEVIMVMYTIIVVYK